MISIPAEAAGTYACEALNQTQDGQVMGVTSAGVFLKVNGRVLFLTEANRRGPVSINLPGRCPQFARVQTGDAVQFGEGGLVLPGAGISISLEGSEVWRAASPPERVKPDREGARTRLGNLAAALLSARPGKGLSWLLEAFLHGAKTVDQETDPLRIFDRALQVKAALNERSPEKTAAALAQLLGYGPGLTPSGDDFVLGVLLLLNRWFGEEWGQDGLSDLNGRVIGAARKSTTALSATLIECAAEGQADEGVVRTADYLANGAGEEGECVESLLGWGSNSGIDTLAGMAVVFK